MVEDKILIKDESQYFISPRHAVAHDNPNSVRARYMGELLSLVLENEKYINDRELVILTSCFSTNDITGSLFAELKLFKSSYFSFEKKNVSEKIPALRNQQFFIAINSGLFKFKSFLRKEPSEIIQRVAENLDSDNRHTWNSLWPEADLDFNLIDEVTLIPILDYGILIYKLNILIRCMDNYFRKDKSKQDELTNLTEDFKSVISLNLPSKYQVFVNHDLIAFHGQFKRNIQYDHLARELTTLLELFDDTGVKLKSPQINNKKDGKRKLKQPDIVNVLLASPGDTQIERAFLLDKLERKFRTDGHEAHCQRRLIVHAWEDIATQSGYAQDIINYKYLKNVDIVLAVFKHKLGTPTSHSNGSIRAESGTAEELLYAINNNASKYPLGMAYFYERPPKVQLDAPDFQKVIDEWERLKKFKDSIKTKIMYKSYDGKLDLLNKACVDVAQNINELF
ncbi:hypothetical protein [Mucilaginibacter rubeus]|uniref:Uncharacterized protein n=1 Tax=Mucilaginibacter rubeus TaxID=2027860 RepID=A0A5C1HTM6_9SPHI|nr:hypothetical protein [Mucilaginibacter rubeus]QEM09186.1 hypothetical protein DEO27_003865 [Mucilaginibacter rubeus]